METIVNEEMKADNTPENPNVTYEPSGLLGSTPQKTGVAYTLFIIVGAVLMQVPIAVASGLAGALIVLGGGTAMQMIFCYVGLAVGFFYLGRLFSFIIRPCTKLMHCRNPKFEKGAITAMIFLTVGIRIAFARVMSEYLNMDVEINWQMWLEWGLMLILFLLGSWAMETSMPPYCEKCRKYMKKETFKISSSDSTLPDTLGILHKLCVADDGEHFEDLEKIHVADDTDDDFLAIHLEACPVCNDGFITVIRHKKEIGTDNKKHKVQIVTYANRLNNKQTVKLRDMLV